MPFFSIIIPVYMVEKYLNQCVDSILNQTCQDFELILIDDGSTDNSPKICDEYALNNEKIKVIHKENGGLSSARNYGLDVASGMYIVFIDSDDYWDDLQALSTIKSKLIKNNFDVLIIGMKKFFQRTNQFKKTRIPQFNSTDLSQKQKIRYLMKQNMFVACAWDKIVRRDFIEKNKMRFVIGQLSEDIEWCARLLIYNPTIDIISSSIYVYRQQNEASITSNIGRNNLSDIKDVILKFIKNENGSIELNHYLAVQYVQWLAISSVVNNKLVDDLVKEMRSYWYLVDYDWYPYVKKVKKFKILGFSIMRRLLGIYRRIKRG